MSLIVKDQYAVDQVAARLEGGNNPLGITMAVGAFIDAYNRQVVADGLFGEDLPELIASAYKDVVFNKTKRQFSYIPEQVVFVDDARAALADVSKRLSAAASVLALKSALLGLVLDGSSELSYDSIIAISMESGEVFATVSDDGIVTPGGASLARAGKKHARAVAELSSIRDEDGILFEGDGFAVLRVSDITGYDMSFVDDLSRIAPVLAID